MNRASSPEQCNGNRPVAECTPLTKATPEATHAPVRVGDAIRLRMEGFTQALATTARAVNRRVDPDTRTYEVRAGVPDPGRLAKVGSYGGIARNTYTQHALTCIGAIAPDLYQILPAGNHVDCDLGLVITIISESGA